MDRLVEGLAFAEGPRWHDGRLWYSHVVVDDGGRPPGAASGRIDDVEVAVSWAGLP